MEEPTLHYTDEETEAQEGKRPAQNLQLVVAAEQKLEVRALDTRLAAQVVILGCELSGKLLLSFCWSSSSGLCGESVPVFQGGLDARGDHTWLGEEGQGGLSPLLLF